MRQNITICQKHQEELTWVENSNNQKIHNEKSFNGMNVKSAKLMKGLVEISKGPLSKNLQGFWDNILYNA